MFRTALETAICYIKRGIPTFKQNGLQVSRQISNLHNAAVPFNAAQQQTVSQLSYRSFFFSHWIKMSSYSARLRCNPVYRFVANKRNSPLYLAFIGLGYLGQNDDSNSRCSTLDSTQLMDKWLQSTLKETFQKVPEKFESFEGMRQKDFKIGERLGKRSSNSAVYAAENHNAKAFAIKMLFNYGTSSQSHSLYQGLSKELTVLSVKEEKDELKENIPYKKLPPHHNVMKIYGSFADDVHKLHDADESYPAALPACHNGYGRNRTLFYIMPRFEGTLSEYVTRHKNYLSERTSLALFTQFLEGLVHLSRNGIVHRDLKGDNLLVNETNGGLPHLVIADFDCCLAEKHFEFVMPYETAETGKGGNTCLMAPEVCYAKPGRGHVIDYSKSDEWSAAVLAYEIFGQQNPFEKDKINKESYENKDLPEVDCASKVVKKLVKQMLARHPNDRPDINLVATVCQLLLCAPLLSIFCNNSTVAPETAKSWLRAKTLGLILEMLKYKKKNDVPVEKQILYTFLSRTSFDEIMEALKWIAVLEKDD